MANVFESRVKELNSKNTSDNPFEARLNEIGGSSAFGAGKFDKYSNFGQSTNPFEDRVQEVDPNETSFSKGIKSSSAGTIGGFEEQGLPGDASMLQSMAFKAGSLVGDAPAMGAGTLAGTATGATIGSLFGPAGTAVGAVIGAGAGMFGLPEFIKQIGKYSRKESKEDVADQFGDILDIAIGTGKQMVVGGATNIAASLAPLAFAAPGIRALAKTRFGKEAISAGIELGTMSVTASGLEGELPSGKDFIENAMMLGAMKGVGAGVRGGKKLLGKKVAAMPTVESARSTLGVLKKGVKKIDKFDFIGKYKRAQKHQEVLRDVISGKNEKIIENQFRLQEGLDKVSKKSISKDNLNKTMDYLNNRASGSELPKDLRNYIDKDIRSHIKKTNKILEKDPYIGKIELDKSNYKNAIDYINDYDKIVSTKVAGSEIINRIKASEKATGDRLIITKHDGAAAVKQAIAEGYHKFDDPSLRSLKGDGVAKYATDGPAYVAPELAGSIQGLFTKKKFDPTTLNKSLRYIGNTFDSVANTLRTLHVKGSFFHYGPLMESFLATPGKPGQHPARLPIESLRKVFSMKSIMKMGDALTSNKALMMDAARSGVVIHRPLERWQTAERVSGKMSEAAMKYLPEKVTSTYQNSRFKKGIDKYVSMQKYLFEKFHPRLKMVSWKNYVDNAVFDAVQKGKPLTPEKLTKVKREMADLVNNQFGGQNWEVQRIFNDPRYKRWLSRVIAYPDWTGSAIRQAAGGLSGGKKGTEARKYWLRFGINALLVNSFMRLVNGGFYTDKDGNNHYSGEKAVKALTDPDPGSMFKFPLPDINVLGLNPGREKGGAKTYTHFGKQALEIKGWANHPLKTLFTKSNPLLRIAYEQGMGEVPTEDEPFVVEGGFRKGMQGRQPWDASDPLTGKRLYSRTKALAKHLSPFSIRALMTKGLAPYLATALGSLPISKGTTPYKAEKLFREAFRKRDATKIRRIIAALRENRFTDKQIRMKLVAAKNYVENKGKTKKKDSIWTT